MTDERLRYLFDRYLSRTCLPGERQELALLCLLPENQAVIEKLLETAWEQTPLTEDMQAEKGALIFQNILKPEPAKVRKLRWRRIAVAASLLLVIGLGSYYLFFNKPGVEVEIAKTQEERFKNDVNPGSYRARLTLADGSIIELDSAIAGELTKQGKTVLMNKEGQLIYQAKDKNNEVFYNTLSTARGETYATVLADGSRVWLNSASRIKFPVAFFGNERKVEITGEAYFEVAKDASKPFTVSVNGVDVQVLGTHFNVNAYNDEAAIKTTLLEGSVKVIKGNRQVTIKPGQQANVKVNEELSIVNDADIDEVMAWKNGRFYFENSSVESIMRQVERWYDVEIEYQDKIPHLFVAKIPRDVPVSELLKLLELTERVHFRIEGKKVIVTK